MLTRVGAGEKILPTDLITCGCGCQKTYVAHEYIRNISFISTEILDNEAFRINGTSYPGLVFREDGKQKSLDEEFAEVF